jgi:hypothetical protein
MKYDGLSEYEMKCIDTPFRDLTKAELAIALDARDKIAKNVQKMNEAYVSDQPFRVNLISDSLAPIRNQADGKIYDSKSAYYAALKSSGHVVVENGMHNNNCETRGDFNVREALKGAAQQHGFI